MTVFRLHHRLHWPFCIALAALVLLGTYLYIAMPQLIKSRAAWREVRQQAQLQQDSLALWPLQPLVAHAMQPLPTTVDIADTLKDKLTDFPLADTHYSLSTPIGITLGNLPAHSQRLTLTFKTNELDVIKAIVMSLPGWLKCHAQLQSFSIDQTTNSETPLTARLEFTLIGTDR